MPAKAPSSTAATDEDALVGAVYSTLDDFGSWQEVLPKVSSWLGAQNALLFTPNEGVSPRAFGISHNIPMDDLRRYGEYYHARDVYKEEAIRRNLMRAGVGFRSNELVSPEAVKRTEIFTDLWRPLDLLHMICYTLTDEREDDLGPATVISLFRAPRKSPFSDEQDRRARRIVPHLRRALSAGRRLESARTVLRAYEAGLAASGEAMIVLAPDMTVRHASALPPELFGPGSLLRVAGGKLAANTGVVRDRLERAVREAAEGRPQEAFRVSYGDALQAEISVLPVSPGQLLARIRLIRHSPERAVGRVAEEFRLTKTEQRVLRLLADGADVAEIAATLAIRPMTVRTHLANLFEKTGERSQRALVALVWRHT